jgi:sugar lactone lactonase YvrE
MATRNRDPKGLGRREFLGAAAVAPLAARGIVGSLGRSAAAGPGSLTVLGGGSSKLRGPWDITTTADGSVLVADSVANRIWKISASNDMTLFAGTGEGGYSQGRATSSKLFFPTGLATAPDGSIYFVDNFSGLVRRINSDGVITRIAGNGKHSFSGDGGPAINATFSYPTGIAVDGQNNVYITDFKNVRVRRIDPSGVISTFAGTGEPGFSGDGGPATRAAMGSPLAIAVDSKGNVFFSDPRNQRIRRVGIDGVITTVAGTDPPGAPDVPLNQDAAFFGDGGPATSAGIGHVYGIAAAPDGALFLSDTKHFRVRRVGPDGVIATIAGNGTPGNDSGVAAVQASIGSPQGLAVDSSNNLLLTDYGNQNVKKIVGAAA